MTLKRFPFWILMIALAASLAACAEVTPEQQAEMDANGDPWESMNRSAYDTAYFFDRLLFRPIAELYRATVPPPLRNRIAGITSNMKEPVIFVNDVLQGDFDKAGTTVERFGINTTLGVGGMWEVANGFGLRQQTGDFGQTLAVWGVDEGPFLMIPVIGPSNVRDGIGRGIDFFMSPWQYLAWMQSNDTLIRFEVADISASNIVRREKNIERIDALRADSLDPYAGMRSTWQQFRRRQIRLKTAPAAATAPEDRKD